MAIGTGCERGGDGVFPVRVVTSAFPSSDMESLTRDEVCLKVCGESDALLAPFAGPVEEWPDASDEMLKSFLVSSS